MTDVLRIAHPQNCPPYGNSRVGICEGNLSDGDVDGDGDGDVKAPPYQVFCLF